MFDKKYKLAKEEATDLRGAIKRLEGRDFDTEIKAMAQQLFENEARSLKHKNACTAIKKKIKKEERKLKKLNDKIAAVPAEPINIEECLSRKDRLLVSQADITSKIEANSRAIEESNKFIEKAKEFLRDFDVDSLGEKRQVAEKQSLELDELVRQIESETRTFDIFCSRAKDLEDIPCGDQFVTSCKFIKDAYKASKLIDGVEKTLEELAAKKASGEAKILELDLAAVEDHLSKYDKLLEKKTKAENDNTKTRLDSERNNNQRLSAEAVLVSNQKDIDYYYQNQEAIENYNGLILRVQEGEKDLVGLHQSLDNCEAEMLDLYKTHGSLEQGAKNLEEQKGELLTLREEFGSYDLYMKCMHNSGIAYDIIKKKLPVINNEIAKILTNIVSFDVFLEDDGRKLDIYIKHPRFEPRPLELGSGAEKTISAMAIRLALLNVSSLPKGNIFILDEPGAALDEENMEGFVRILDMVKGYFKTVLLISHLDSLKDSVDTQIVIDKKKGFAYINQ